MGKDRRSVKIVVDSFGNLLSIQKGQIIIKNKDGVVKKIPLSDEIDEIQIASGNLISTGLLTYLGCWDIPLLVQTRVGRPIAVLKDLEDDSHISTRLAQYEATKNGKGCNVAKNLVIGKIQGQNWVLGKYGLTIPNLNIVQRVESLETDSLKDARQRLTSFEGKMSELYLREIFRLIPEKLRPAERQTFQDYDGVNNIFNLAYKILSWKVHRALTSAKLEPYLGFLHSVQYGKPSLVCDFQELYRYLIDDFLIDRCQKLHKNDFVFVTDFMMRLRRGKRIHLCKYETNELADALDSFFQRNVDVPRIRVGRRQRIEALIGEEALELAK